MGIQVLPTPNRDVRNLGLHLTERAEMAALDLPRYVSEQSCERRDPLGCIRGIFLALAFQGVVVLGAFALWRLL